MNKNNKISYSLFLDEESDYKLDFMSYCLDIKKDKIISDLILEFKNVKDLSNIFKVNTPINFFYAKDRINNKKYKVIYVKKESLNEEK